MIDEKAHRREEWNEDQSTWVKLSDGQEWALPRPRLTMIPEFKDGSPIHLWHFYSYPAEIQETFEKIGQSEQLEVSLLAAIALGGKLLLANYELTDEELSVVFRYRFGEESSEHMLHEIIDMATGGLVSYAGRGVLLDPKPASHGFADA